MAKRKIPDVFLEPLEDVRATNLLETSQFVEMVKAETYPAIKEAFEAKKTFATLFRLKGTDYCLDVPRNYWIAALEECINHKLESEDFEECVQIKELIDEIKKPIKTISKKTKLKGDDGATFE